MNPSSLRPTIHQEGEGGGHNALLRLAHPRLWKSPSPEDVSEKTPVNRVIGLSKIHLPHKSGGAISTPSCYNLLRQHNTIRHLPARNKGRLERANQRWQHPLELVGQHLCEYQVLGVGQRNQAEITKLLRPLNLRQQHDISFVKPVHLASTGLEIFQCRHDFVSHHVPAVHVEE